MCEGRQRRERGGGVKEGEREREISYKELAHMIMEADKSQDLPGELQAGDLGEPRVF